MEYKSSSCASAPLVLTVEFMTVDYNTSESSRTVEVVLVANGTSQFYYSVALMIENTNTGR